MARKRIVVFYHQGKGNEAIAETDYASFYTTLQHASREIQDLQVESFDIPAIHHLNAKVKTLIDDQGSDELYLHFSGHGNEDGIPYDTMILQNAELAAQLDHSKIKFCFFSSCESAALVRLVNERDIPIVIGTLGNNAISNTYAIEFQKAFYHALLQSRKFENAFEVARDELKFRFHQDISSQIIIRGESGGPVVKEQINALQIVFSDKQYAVTRLIPSNFLLEMRSATADKPFLLTWFDQAIEGERFKNQFDASGFYDQFQYIQLVKEDLNLINNRGDDDPFQNENIRLLICCSTPNVIHDELRKHLITHNWALDHYKPLLAIQQNLNPEQIIGDPRLLQIIPQSNLIRYKDVEKLFEDNSFLNELMQHSLSFSERKEITFAFNSKPVKEELIEIEDQNKFIRVFLAKNLNELLINFLVNWIRTRENQKSRNIIIDNILDPNLDFVKELEKEINTSAPSPIFELNLATLYSTGVIIVIRSHSSDMGKFNTDIQGILKLLNSGTPIYQTKKPETPSYLFFLFEESAQFIPQQDPNIYFKKFSDPLPVDTDILDEWTGQYSLLNHKKQIVDEVRRVGKAIDVEAYKSSCPSAVIQVICDELKIPRRQVLGIQ